MVPATWPPCAHAIWHAALLPSALHGLWVSAMLLDSRHLEHARPYGPGRPVGGTPSNLLCKCAHLPAPSTTQQTNLFHSRQGSTSRDNRASAADRKYAAAHVHDQSHELPSPGGQPVTPSDSAHSGGVCKQCASSSDTRPGLDKLTEHPWNAAGPTPSICVSCKPSTAGPYVRAQHCRAGCRPVPAVEHSRPEGSPPLPMGLREGCLDVPVVSTMAMTTVVTPESQWCQEWHQTLAHNMVIRDTQRWLGQVPTPSAPHLQHKHTHR
jgi:hypothetical protein